MRKAVVVAALIALWPAWNVLSQQSDQGWRPFQEAKEKQDPAAQATQSKPRVFITDSTSWEISGGFGGSSAGFGGGVKGGARPQKAEIIKTFGERCPEVTVTIKSELADSVVILDHEGGKGLVQRKNKVAVFNKSGDSIFSESTRSLGNAVQDACGAIANAPVPAGPSPAPAAPAVTVAPASTHAPAPPVENSTVVVKSDPDGADITVDGKFMGSTPSTLHLVPGDHVISIEKSGRKTWKRTMSLGAGDAITVNATLETNP